VAQGRFREDLFYRLNVIPLRLPPLRERYGDALLLAQYFLARFAEKNNKVVRGFSERAAAAIDAHKWPGNVRELENSIERAVVLCRGDVIGIEDLPETVANAAERSKLNADGIVIPYGMPLHEIELRVIQETLERCGGDKKTAARLLGIASRTIYRKVGE
jgi:two-component system response regulator HydG